jgi:hypothetical protein
MHHAIGKVTTREGLAHLPGADIENMTSPSHAHRGLTTTDRASLIGNGDELVFFSTDKVNDEGGTHHQRCS